MSSPANASVHGRQRTLAQWMNGNIGRPAIPQRAAKRQRRNNKMTGLHDFMKGQQTLAMRQDGNWNLRAAYDRDRNKLEREYWGDALQAKEPNHIRIVSKNIQGLGLTAGNPKEDEIKTWLVNKQIDIIGLQEININWYKCKNKDRFGERMRSPAWEYIRYSVAHNKHDPQHRHQFGGCITAGIDQITHRVSGSGADDRGLGRWSWLLLKGRNNIIVRVISVYQPNMCHDHLHPGSVYSQHRRYFQSIGMDDCPLKLFQDDFIKQLQAWIKQNNKIIILIDANEDVRSGTLSTRLETVGLVSAIRRQHGNHCPPTQHSGSTPIDDIWVSRDIHPTRTGYMSFCDGPGDHRALYLDINSDHLFGGDFHKIHRIPARRLVSSNPKVVEKFNALLDEKLTLHNVHQRMEKLQVEAGEHLTEEQIREYEKCDNILVNAFKYADKRCRNLRMGEVCYEPEKIQRYGTMIRLCTYLIRKKCNRKVSSSKIRKLAKKLDVSKPFEISVDDAVALRAEARKEYMKHKPNSRTLRNKWMEKKAVELGLEDGEDKAKFIRRQRLREELKDSHKRIKTARGAGFRAGTDRVTIKNNEGNLIEVIERADMEKILMETNKIKFTQANDTPFMQSPLLGDVGLDGLTLEADKILLGTYDLPQEIDSGAADFIKAVQMDEQLKNNGPISPDIDTAEHIKYWQRARESTSSSMSGLHFGFYKATALCSNLAKTIASFTRIPFTTGFSPWRFRGDLNVSVMKEEGNYRPEKQRTIHLLEANFSQGAKIIFSRRMLDNARRFKQIPEEQYARKGGKSIDAVLHKVLVYDYMRMSRTPGLCFSSDLMNNYDRMCHSVGSLAMRSLGVPICALKCLTRTLQGMRHHIRTAYGDSDTFYSGEPTAPLQGGGQGNPAAPPMWVAITIILVKILSMYAPGVALAAPISAVVIAFTAIMYVDDTDLFIVGSSTTEKLPSVIERSKKIVAIWCRSIWATGGLLRPDKCYYYLIGFKWIGSRWKYMTREDLECNITIKNQEGEDEEIKRHNPDFAEETLGVFVAVDGNTSQQKDKLTDATTSWTHRIVTSGLFRNEVVMALITTLSRTWQYPLQATTFSLQDCEDIMKPLYSEFLPKMGASQKIPLAFRYGPKSCMGLGLPHVYTMQGIAQTKALLDHIQKETMVGKFLHMELEMANLEVGVGGNILAMDFDKYGHFLTDCWLKSLWQFCHTNEINIQGKYRQPQTQRHNDFFIMEKLVSKYSDAFTKAELRSINRCRLFMRHVVMSDLVTGDGTKFTQKAYSGIKDSGRKSKWKWPLQRNPSRSEWRLWQKALCLLANDGTRTTRTLATPLGLWVHESHQDFQWFYSPSSQCVYHRKTRGWMRFYKSARDRTVRDRCNYRQDVEVLHAPFDIQPTTLSQGPNGGQIWIEGSSGSENIPSVMQGQHWFQSLAQSLSAQTVSLLRHTVFLASEDDICDAFLSGEWMIVTDGSYHPEYNIGTAAVVIEHANGTPLLQCWVKTPGRHDDLNAYRSELTGVYCGCLIIKIFELHCAAPAPKIVFGCDNETAVNTGLMATKYSPIMAKHFDLLWEIQHFVTTTDSKLQPVHVRGHQSWEACTRSQTARMNSDADMVAKRYLSQCIEDPTITIEEDVGGLHWSLSILGHKIVKNIDEAINAHIHGRRLRKHLSSKYKWDEVLVNRIDWDSIQRTSGGDTTSESLWKMKMASGFVPTGDRMMMYKKWDSNLCPRCRSCPETIQHMLSCNESGASIARMARIRDFKRWMEQTQTDPDLTTTIIKTLLSRRSGSFSDHLPATASRSLRLAAAEQDRLGGISAFRGFITKGWYEAQKDFWDSLSDSRMRSIKQWASRFLRQWYAFSQALWKQRNFFLHHKNNFWLRQEAERKVNEQVIEQFNLGGADIGDADIHLVQDTDLSEMLLLDVKRKSQWVANVTAARKRRKISESNEMVQMRRFMKNWQGGIRDNG